MKTPKYFDLEEFRAIEPMTARFRASMGEVNEKTAQEYGLDPAQISLIGFSAGGYEAGGFIHLVQGRNLFPEGYQPDEVDKAEDSVLCAGLIYPALSFDHNVGVLFCLFDGFFAIQNDLCRGVRRYARFDLLRNGDFLFKARII